MTNVMLDLETLGTQAGSIILSIGAVKFDTEKVTDKFYANINLKSSAELGATVDLDTVRWWMGQSEEARKAAFSLGQQSHGQSVSYVLDEFGRWATGSLSTFAAMYDINRREVRMWGNGADFDNVLLSWYYKKTNIREPWAYHNSRCYRTLKSIHPDMPKLERIGTHHNAVDDAESQALHLIMIWKWLGLNTKVDER